MTTKAYPDLKELFAKRAAGRVERARMSVADKLEVLDQLKAGAEPFRAARARRPDDAPTGQPDKLRR